MAEGIKNRGKFEWAVITIVLSLTGNYIWKGVDLPAGYTWLLAVAILAYVILFLSDQVIPIVQEALKRWSADNPPKWVQEVLTVAKTQNALMDRLLTKESKAIVP